MKNNKKGFTITELVIVIAVIAILAAVLIPTFSSVVNKSKESKATQEARSIVVEFNANNAEEMLELTTTQTAYYIVVKKDASTNYTVEYSAEGYKVVAKTVTASSEIVVDVAGKRTTGTKDNSTILGTGIYSVAT